MSVSRFGLVFLLLLPLAPCFAEGLQAPDPIALSPRAKPSLGPNSLTIWAQSAVDAMKANRENLYNSALSLYQHQTYFDDPVNCVNPPVPNSRYLIGAPCPRANLVSLFVSLRLIHAWMLARMSRVGNVRAN